MNARTPTASEGRIFQFLSALPEVFDAKLASGAKLDAAIYANDAAMTLRIIPIQTNMPPAWNKRVIGGIFAQSDVFLYAYVDTVDMEEQQADGTRSTSPAVFAVATDGNAMGSICLEIVEKDGRYRTGSRKPFPIESPVMRDWMDLLAPVHQA